MTNTDTTTPRLKAVKGLAEALASRNLSNAEPVLSKNFTAKLLPKIATLPSDLTKEEYLQKYGAVVASFAKVEFIFHEVIEAPEKVVAHLAFFFTTVDGITVNYDSIFIFSFVDEDGEVKILNTKVFSDPEQRGLFHTEAAKGLARGTPVA